MSSSRQTTEVNGDHDAALISRSGVDVSGVAGASTVSGIAGGDIVEAGVVVLVVVVDAINRFLDNGREMIVANMISAAVVDKVI